MHRNPPYSSQPDVPPGGWYPRPSYPLKVARSRGLWPLGSQVARAIPTPGARLPQANRTPVCNNCERVTGAVRNCSVNGRLDDWELLRSLTNALASCPSASLSAPSRSYVVSRWVASFPSPRPYLIELHPELAQGEVQQCLPLQPRRGVLRVASRTASTGESRRPLIRSREPGMRTTRGRRSGTHSSIFPGRSRTTTPATSPMTTITATRRTSR